MVILGMAVAVTVIVGSLSVGDSVKNSLLNVARLRLGKTGSALISSENMLQVSLAEKVTEAAKTKTAPLLMLKGMAADSQGKYRINQANVIGIDKNFSQFALISTNTSWPEKTNAIINKTTAKRLELKTGDDFILRVEKPDVLPADVPLLSEKDNTLSIRLTVKGIADDDFPGNLSFRNSQSAPANIFLPLNWLSQKTKKDGRANVIIAQEVNTEKLQEALNKVWSLDDVGLNVTKKKNGVIELKSEKIFISDKVSEQALKLPGSQGVLTYFVNSIELKSREGKTIRRTPYSFVTGIERESNKSLPFLKNKNQEQSFNNNTTSKGNESRWIDTLDLRGKTNQEDAIVINQWLADDLQAKVGDTIELKYFIPGPMRKLSEEQHSFIVKAIIPITGLAADRSLMPDFPGLSDTEKCSDWDSSIPIKMGLIRDKDEAYWKEYKGTPKAFISLKTAQSIWGNRFGNLTLIRFSPGKNINPLKDLRNSLKPADFDLSFRPVKQEAEKSINRGTGGNFSWLFMSLSFFLLFSAFMLTTLLFILGVESRCREFAIMESMGFSIREIRKLFMQEGLILACIGAIIGAPLGLLFNSGVLYCLESVWQGAIGTTTVSASVNPWTPFAGAFAGVIIAWITMRISLGKYTKNLKKANEEKAVISEIPRRIKTYLIFSIVLCVAGVALIIIGLLADNPGANPAIFFGSGGILILSDWLCWRFCLEWIKKHNLLAQSPTPLRLALKNTTFKPMCSMAAVILLSCGIFLTIAVAINKRTTANPREKNSGTGGYAFFIKTSIPVTHDMNTEKGQSRIGLDKELFKDVSFVNMSLSEGDNASCLNLNQVRRPGILGVDFAKFANPERFTFVNTGSGIAKDKAWEELSEKNQSSEVRGRRSKRESNIKSDKAKPQKDAIIVPGTNRTENLPNVETISAVADQEVIMWSMGKIIGSDLDITDEKGVKQKLQLDGALASSVFQGYVLIPESKFVMLFPTIGGAKCILVDVPAGKEEKVKEALAKALIDYGAEITSCRSRLDEFYRVANTYLSIFLILGGLGVLIGTAGFGAIVLRNITERRFELAIMNSSGFSKALIRKIVTQEHALLILAGGFSGGITAFVAVIPALYNSAATNPPYLLVISLFLLILVCGIISVYIAAWFATRGSTLSALRKE